MRLTNISISILGYGNQGRAHALNLRDKGITVFVGARKNRLGWRSAKKDGFHVFSLEEATERGDVVLFLTPDLITPKLHDNLKEYFKGKYVGFAHGIGLHSGWIKAEKHTHYFLAAPKGSGYFLRKNFLDNGGMYGAYASWNKEKLDNKKEKKTLLLAKNYLYFLGIQPSRVFKTSFREEVECDLLGEQVVLCGGLIELMQTAFEVLVKEGGHNPKMAAIDCFVEVVGILELWLTSKQNTKKFYSSISSAAAYGGITRGRGLINNAVKKEIKKYFSLIHNKTFYKEFKNNAHKLPGLIEEQTKQWKKLQFKNLPTLNE